MKVQVHPSYGYEDFVRGIRPRENGGFGVENGTLVQMALRAQAEPMQQFVLLLDEINRANVAKVMGEALSLIEGDKREAKHAVQLGLAHDGKREFHLPPNLYIIATMNTADRSIALVDYALRRRFAFFTLQPAFDRDEFRQWLLEALGADDSEHDADARSTQAEARKVTDRIVETMRSVNDRIRGHKALGPNYVLGHSFFCTYQAALGESATAWVERVFKTEIAPLLEEYAVEHPRLKQELLDLIQG
jgi:5-methylcytosine-specific restriction protein B